MKFYLFFVCVFLCQNVFSQSAPDKIIDTSNYYDNCTNKGSLNWLRISDAVPIIINELEKNGYSYASIDIGKLYRMNKEEYFTLTIAVDDDIPFGFIYQQGHGVPLDKNDRLFLTHDDTSKPQYVQFETFNGTANKYIPIKKLPKNIFILDERCYWYEFDQDKKINYPVSKDVISSILRQDIRAYLKRLAKK